MTQVKLLGEQEIKKLYQEFPKGRPLRFATPAMPGGFSLVAAFSNLFEKLYFCERTPKWVRRGCDEVQRREMSGGGSLVRANSKVGSLRIALLLDYQSGKPPRGWLIAVWDGKTGEPCSFPI